MEQAGGKILLPKTSIGTNGFMAQFVDTEGNKGLYTPRSNKRQAVASLPPSYLITIIMKPTTKLFLTAKAYIIPTMILGYTWHLIFFKDLYDSLGVCNRAEPIIPLGSLP
jgi:hypothetical protein